MQQPVVVVGSINVDLVVRAERLPRPGETVQGGRFEELLGGKGANQAVAAARAGASVIMIGAVGGDAHGRASLSALEAEGVDISRVRTVEHPTGVALIGVGARGENQILLAPGANAALTADDVALDEIGPCVVLTSFEIPLAVAVEAARRAVMEGGRAIVTPAPAHALPAELLNAAPILVPNEHELVVSIGNDDPAAALDDLSKRTAGAVVVTQGPAGALLAVGERRERFDGHPVASVVDTTGAGDAFAGAMAAWLARGASLDDAIRAGNAAGSLSVRAPGARGSLGDRAQIEALLAR